MAETDAPSKKRRKLNYDKCTFCRRDKKRCDPANRQWPTKCDRCEELGFACSESKNLRATKPSLETEDKVAIESTGDLGSKGSQNLVECEDWELELSWLRRCEDYVARIHLTNNSGYHGYEGRIDEIEDDISGRKNEISVDVEELLPCLSPLAKQAALSVVSRMISQRPIDYAEHRSVGSAKTLGALMESAKSSGRIDIELSLRECLLHDMDACDTAPQDMINAVKDYEEACDRYMDRIRRFERPECFEFLNSHKTSFHFNGDIRILRLLVRHSSEFLFQRRDIFLQNALLAAFLIAEQKDLKNLVSTMDNAIFLQLAKNGTENKSKISSDTKPTILHVAAMRNTTCVFDKAKTLRPRQLKSVIESKDRDARTPLLCAATHGHCTIVKMLLDMEADPQARDSSEQNALHWAVINGHEDVTQMLIKHTPFLCSAIDMNEKNPIELAIKHNHLGIIKKFFSQEFRALLDNDGYGVEVYMDLLRVGFENKRSEVIELLEDGPFIGRINQRNRYGQTALHLAVEARNSEAIGLLLERGAEVMEGDIFDRSAYDYAKEQDLISVLEGRSALDSN